MRRKKLQAKKKRKKNEENEIVKLIFFFFRTWPSGAFFAIFYECGNAVGLPLLSIHAPTVLEFDFVFSNAFYS